MAVKTSLTIYPSELRWTVACVSTKRINTAPIILTGITMAIESCITISSCESW